MVVSTTAEYVAETSHIAVETPTEPDDACVGYDFCVTNAVDTAVDEMVSTVIANLPL